MVINGWFLDRELLKSSGELAQIPEFSALDAEAPDVIIWLFLESHFMNIKAEADGQGDLESVTLNVLTKLSSQPEFLYTAVPAIVLVIFAASFVHLVIGKNYLIRNNRIHLMDGNNIRSVNAIILGTSLAIGYTISLILIVFISSVNLPEMVPV